VHRFLHTMVAIAFTTGGVGFIVWIGIRFEDDDTSWYPKVPASVATRLLSVAAIAASLAAVTWLYIALT
jgi:hypothetical protein